MFGFLNRLIAPRGGKVLANGKGAATLVPLELEHVELLQLMWGQGFSRPGGREFLEDITAALVLDSRKSVIDLAAGLGGQARMLVDLYKTHVTGFERNADLALNGNKISARGGFGRSAPIQHYDPHNLEYDKRADVVIMRELLYTLEDKDAAIVRMSAHLKDNGHAVIIDYTCDPALAGDPAIAAWVACEPYGAHLIADAELVRLLVKHGFDVRVSKDITPAYIKMVLQGLASLPAHFAGKKPGPNLKALLARETDLWAARLGALTAGARFVRFHAIKKS